MKNKDAKTPGKKSIFASFKAVNVYIRKYRVIMILALLLVLASTMVSLIGPYLGKLMGDIIVDGSRLLLDGSGNPVLTPENLPTIVYSFDLDKIAKFGIIIISLYAISFAISIIYSFMLNFVTQKTAEKMRNEIAVKINNLPLNYFDTTSQGDILSRVTNDVDTLSSTLNNNLSTLIFSVTATIGALLIMFLISWQIGLLVIGVIPVTVVLTMVVMRGSQKYFIGHQKVLGEANGFIEESYTGQKITKAFNAQEKRQDEFEEISERVKSNAWKSQFFSGTLFPIVNFMSNVAFVFAAVIGGILVSKGALTIATIPMFAIYIRMFNQSIGQVGQVMTELQAGAAASDRVFEFLNAGEMSSESHKNTRLEPETIEGLVVFENVKFGYDSDRIIINNFSAYAKQGQKIAIVGPTGAGKTTIVNLLMRFYDIDSGDITIDGTSIYDIKRENVRQLFGMVLQDTWLFSGTIFENLSYGKEGVTLEDVKKAATLANVDHFIESLPGGYNMVLDENADISQGQRQLLTIARAMVQNAPMLILDEATSNVDTRTELLIQGAMDNLMKNRTTFVIAHRLSTIKNSNLILVMKDGNIIEKGKHHELMSADGFYTKLYNSQFEQGVE